MNKNKLLVIWGSVVFIIAAYSLVWYIVSYKPYAKYEEGFKEFDKSGKKLYVDNEGYTYSVKKPDYFTWTGNLAIVDMEDKASLIIWPIDNGKNMEVGVIIEDNGVSNQIELKDKKTAVYDDQQELVNQYNEQIEILYNKANEVWGIGID
ncbi:MAG: hypothetical protein K6G26_04955 [Lachnospiraceae bacterium]|nr:hypothetical protein [Lachnospiraceae bacterium]